MFFFIIHSVSWNKRDLVKTVQWLSLPVAPTSRQGLDYNQIRPHAPFASNADDALNQLSFRTYPFWPVLRPDLALTLP